MENPSSIGRLPAALAALGRPAPWLRAFTYALFAFSTFSISGIELSLVLLYLFALWHWWRSAPRESLPLWVLAPFVTWLVVAVISALVNPDPVANLAELRHQYRIFLPVALLLALREVDLARLIRVYLLFVAIIAAYGAVQYFWGVDWLRPEGEKPFGAYFQTETGQQFYRARGNFSGPNGLATMTMMSGTLFLSLISSEKGYHRYLWLGGAVAAMLALLLSLGRSAWLGMGVGIVVLTLRLPVRWAVPTAIAILGVGFLLIVAVGSGWAERYLGSYGESAIIQRLATEPEADVARQVRLLLWQAGLRAIAAEPWLGVGLGNQDRIIPFHVKVFGAGNPQSDLVGTRSVLHNMYLQAAFYLGLAGLMAFLAMWGAIFMWNCTWIARAGEDFAFEKAVLWGTGAALVAAMVDGVFQDTYFSGIGNSHILMFMGLALFAGERIRLAWMRSGGASAGD